MSIDIERCNRPDQATGLASAWAERRARRVFGETAAAARHAERLKAAYLAARALGVSAVGPGVASASARIAATGGGLVIRMGGGADLAGFGRPQSGPSANFGGSAF